MSKSQPERNRPPGILSNLRLDEGLQGRSLWAGVPGLPGVWEMKHLALLLLFLVAMGPDGREALSQMTGLEVTSGTYDLREQGAIIRADDRSKGGLREIHCLWIGGLPQVVLTRLCGVET